jgi:hypothetical protein
MDSSEATSASLNSLQRNEGLINGQGECCNLYPALVTTDKCEDSFLFPANHSLICIYKMISFMTSQLYKETSVDEISLHGFPSLSLFTHSVQCNFSRTAFSAQCGHHQVQFPAFAVTYLSRRQFLLINCQDAVIWSAAGQQTLNVRRSNKFNFTPSNVIRVHFRYQIIMENVGISVS